MSRFLRSLCFRTWVPVYCALIATPFIDPSTTQATPKLRTIENRLRSLWSRNHHQDRSNLRLRNARPNGIAFLTGTFDPIHLDHVNVAKIAKQELGVDRVILVPRPPYGVKTPVELSDRVAMVNLATRDLEGIEVASKSMLSLMTQSGDYALAIHLLTQFQGIPIYRIQGSDAFNDNLRDGIVDLNLRRGIRFAVVPREGYPVAEPLPNHVVVLSATENNRSSTTVRRALKQGEMPEGIHPDVLNYIREHHLYRDSP